MSEATNQIREKAAELVNRISSDADFKAQVAKDPEAALVAAGLPKASVAEFIAEELSGEVSGYLVDQCSLTCVLTSCTITSL
ncbi:hypothetical protein [Tengunoibacter tsumagoiensis]|uniref:Nif11 domain-containing protein n=1 Tax=Tengunoibacter tsumagoiensis TaxID=2014871 RepID=A0A402A116_9CHLR|nr:hypothetical protein [Tengunoibacter tsumagoiensis]GCE12804.1 hypothetical protein KTT_26630 [Tengunoibacter tsumagoiensis]